eukprot:2906805-Amphidinium_carterae.1
MMLQQVHGSSEKKFTGQRATSRKRNLINHNELHNRAHSTVTHGHAPSTVRKSCPKLWSS